MTRDDLRDVLALLAPVKRKLAHVASRCVAAIVRDSTSMQSAQVENLSGEAFDPIEHMQPGGLSHVALGGAEGVRVTMAGVYDDSVVLALSNRANRPTGLASGDTCVYSASATQSTVTMRASGDVEVQAAPGRQIKLSTSGAPTQSFVLGDTQKAALDALVAALGAYAVALTGSGVGNLTKGDAAAAGATLATSLTAVSSALAASLSIVVKGE